MVGLCTLKSLSSLSSLGQTMRGFEADTSFSDTFPLS